MGGPSVQLIGIHLSEVSSAFVAPDYEIISLSDSRKYLMVHLISCKNTRRKYDLLAEEVKEWEVLNLHERKPPME